MKINFLTYALMLLIFASAMWGILESGKVLSTSVPAVEHTTDNTLESLSRSSDYYQDPIGLKHALRHFLFNLKHPIGIMLMQILAVVVTASVFGSLFHKMGQPSVIGEIIAGIILGPSFLGWIFPDMYQFIFPSESLVTLQVLSRIGVLLFMFVVGMELDLNLLKKKSHAAVFVSHASIIVPFFMGSLIALYLFDRYAPVGTPFFEFCLFMGIALSITAFPVLARILVDQNMMTTPLGTMAMAAAAVDDATAWALLAIIVALVESTTYMVGFYILFFAVIFVMGMLFVVRPLLTKLFLGNDSFEKLRGRNSLVIVILLIFLSGLYTRCIGIHSLFGAFMAGVVIPNHSPLKVFLRQRIEHVSSVFLLPLFFAYTGIRTDLGLISDVSSLQDCLLIVMAAVSGKILGAGISARITGMAWPEAWILGALMNTRGLMELVVLNIGYDLGILTSKMFAMMVIMALVTTFMTAPLVRLIRMISPNLSKNS